MSADSYTIDKRSKVRVGKRADYDRAAVHAVLDAGMIAHVGFVVDDRPVVIPMIFGRDGEVLYVHGAKATRLVKALSAGVPACLEVTLVDGIVVGRSAFHSSMNYRSVVVHGTARRVKDIDEHARALEIVTEHTLPGRWAEVRPMLDKEIKATGVIAIDIEAASVKSRAGDPIDEDSDYDDPVWGGVIPVRTVYGEPYGDARLLDGVEVPRSVAELAAARR